MDRRERLIKIMVEWAFKNKMLYAEAHAKSLADALIEAGVKFRPDYCEACRCGDIYYSKRCGDTHRIYSLGKALFCPKCGAKRNEVQNV